MTFYEAMTPLIEAFDSFDRRTADRFLFGRLITALHTHWPSARATATQDDDPAANLLLQAYCRAWEAGIFHVQLSPAHNQAHHNHLHLDVGGGNGGRFLD